jgi:hypothetical protein
MPCHFAFFKPISISSQPIFISFMPTLTFSLPVSTFPPLPSFYGPPRLLPSHLNFFQPGPFLPRHKLKVQIRLELSKTQIRISCARITNRDKVCRQLHTAVHHPLNARWQSDCTRADQDSLSYIGERNGSTL